MMKRGSRYVHVVCVPQRVVQHVHLSRNFPAVPSPLQVVAGTTTQAAYIKAFPDLAGSAPNVSQKVTKFHQVGRGG